MNITKVYHMVQIMSLCAVAVLVSCASSARGSVEGQTDIGIAYEVGTYERYTDWSREAIVDKYGRDILYKVTAWGDAEEKEAINLMIAERCQRLTKATEFNSYYMIDRFECMIGDVRRGGGQYHTWVVIVMSETGGVHRAPDDLVVLQGVACGIP